MTGKGLVRSIIGIIVQIAKPQKGGLLLLLLLLRCNGGCSGSDKPGQSKAESRAKAHFYLNRNSKVTFCIKENKGNILFCCFSLSQAITLRRMSLGCSARISVVVVSQNNQRGYSPRHELVAPITTRQNVATWSSYIKCD